MEHTLQLGEILKDGMYPVESEGGDNWRILHGDTLKLVKAFQPGTFDADTVLCSRPKIWREIAGTRPLYHG